MARIFWHIYYFFRPVKSGLLSDHLKQKCRTSGWKFTNVGLSKPTDTAGVRGLPKYITTRPEAVDWTKEKEEFNRECDKRMNKLLADQGFKLPLFGSSGEGKSTIIDNREEDNDG